MALAAIMVAVFASACAEQKIDPSSAFPYESFEAWVKKYDPKAEKKPSGVYINFIERSADWTTLPAPVLNKSWLSVNFTARTFGHNVIETRDSTLTRMLGIWAVTTHFTNDFVSYNVSQQLSDGLVDALSYMRAGDVARIYIPANLGYLSSMSVNSGYSVSGVTYAGFPLYFDLRLTEIVDNAQDDELMKLRARALASGFDLVKDSVDKGLYMRITKSNPKGDTITADSTVKIWFGAYFEDNKLAITNNDTIAKEAGYYLEADKKNYVSRTVSPVNFNALTGTYLVFPKTVIKMRKGESAEVLAASWWGAGMQGSLSATPQMLPFESLRYQIKVIDEYVDPNTPDTSN